MPKSKEGYGQNPRVDFWTHYDLDVNGCWNWRGGKNHKGQGAVRYEGHNWNTSRLSWTLTHGPIPDGMWVLHKCDNPPCINPDHLWLGTPSDNVRDMVTKGRYHKRPRKMFADCHPTKSHLARGMCSACYQKEWARENR